MVESRTSMDRWRCPALVCQEPDLTGLARPRGKATGGAPVTYAVTRSASFVGTLNCRRPATLGMAGLRRTSGHFTSDLITIRSPTAPGMTIHSRTVTAMCAHCAPVSIPSNMKLCA